MDQLILKSIGAEEISSREFLQELWSGYGKIERLYLWGGFVSSVVVKHIRVPHDESHPRGWNTDISRQRKIHSYNVETHWYEKWSSLCNDSCHVPELFAMEKISDEVLLILEDLDSAGYPVRKSSVRWIEVQAGLTWLANFHAVFMGKSPEGLWPIGTYWHLDTRPDELEAMGEVPLKRAARLIDRKLEKARYKTFVHGDAKLANFCFSERGDKVAAVDFQYVGGGCGMKDVAYFVGSCLSESSCESRESEILDFYFSELEKALIKNDSAVDFADLEEEWRSLYHLAWTDFFRFLQGWSPGHWKINSYSEKIAGDVLQTLKDSGELK